MGRRKKEFSFLDLCKAAGKQWEKDLREAGISEDELRRRVQIHEVLVQAETENSPQDNERVLQIRKVLKRGYI